MAKLAFLMLHSGQKMSKFIMEVRTNGRLRYFLRIGWMHDPLPGKLKKYFVNK